METIMIINRNMTMIESEVIDSPEVINFKNIKLKLASLRQGYENLINGKCNTVELF